MPPAEMIRPLLAEELANLQKNIRRIHIPNRFIAPDVPQPPMDDQVERFILGLPANLCV